MRKCKFPAGYLCTLQQLQSCHIGCKNSPLCFLTVIYCWWFCEVSVYSPQVARIAVQQESSIKKALSHLTQRITCDCKLFCPRVTVLWISLSPQQYRCSLTVTHVLLQFCYADWIQLCTVTVRAEAENGLVKRGETFSEVFVKYSNLHSIVVCEDLISDKFSFRVVCKDVSLNSLSFNRLLLFLLFCPLHQCHLHDRKWHRLEMLGLSLAFTAEAKLMLITNLDDLGNNCKQKVECLLASESNKKLSKNTTLPML